jgi:hypothetical protein
VLRFEDSDGTVTTVDGKLVGINADVQIPLLENRYGVAIRPDPSWVANTITTDQKVSQAAKTKNPAAFEGRRVSFRISEQDLSALL